jgi:uncharacterized protein with GYD domain
MLETAAPVQNSRKFLDRNAAAGPVRSCATRAEYVPTVSRGTYVKGAVMARYLFEVDYTLEGIRGVVAKGGTARKAAAQQAVESAGGTLEAYYFAFGGTDVYVIADFPDHISAAALALTVAAAGGVTVRTVVLLAPEDIDAATKKSVDYTPPGK